MPTLDAKLNGKAKRDPDLELGRLCQAIAKSRLQLRFFRQKRTRMVREFLGSHYSEDANEKSTPVNLVAMFVNIVSRKLVPKQPRVLLSTFKRSDRPAVSIMQGWLNEEIDKLNIANTLRRIVIDALYCVGIAKVAIADPIDADAANWTLSVGQPFIERVDLDDFAYDIHAKDFSEAGWFAQRSRVPLDLVRGSKFYGPNARYVEATPDPMFNLEGDERISMIGRGYYSNEEEYEDFTDIWEIYDRRKKLIITVAGDSMANPDPEDKVPASYMHPDDMYGKGRRRALRVQKWVGPDCGPYHFLCFNTVPGNAMPKGPVHDIYDLHSAANNVLRKLIREAQDTKKITLISSGKIEDGQRVTKTPDGHACSVEDPKAIAQVTMNEPNQNLAVLLEALVSRASWVAGNLDLMGGLGPQAKTATQDKINADASSTNIGSLQDDTLVFVETLFESMLWFYHHHPTNVYKSKYEHPGLPRVSLVRYSFPDNPEVHQNKPGVVVRGHSYADMKIKVDPYSLQHQTPQQRAQMMTDAVRNIYLPMAQLAMQQGISLDLNALFRKLGEYWDDPDITEIFQYMQKPPEEGGGTGSDHAAGVGVEGAPAGSKDPTEIIRRSLGAESQQAKEALMSNMMAKGAANGQPMQVGGQPR